MGEPSMTPLVERFSGIERQMEAEAKARKDNEDYTFTSISDTMLRLQSTLDAEKLRREEAEGNIKALFETKAYSMEEKLNEMFAERFDQVQSTVSSLNDRMTEIEKGFSRSRDRYLKDAQDRATLVAKEVATIHSVMKEEAECRREREGDICIKLQEVEVATADKVVRGQQICDQKFEHLFEVLQDSRLSRESGDRRFQARVIEEVSSLKDSLVRESQTREQADDDIVSALNYYTKELQRATRRSAQGS